MANGLFHRWRGEESEEERPVVAGPRRRRRDRALRPGERRLSLRSEARTDPGRAEAEIDRVLQIARETQAELRSLVFELRPPRLDTDGLVATVGKDLDVLGRAHGLKAALQIP